MQLLTYVPRVLAATGMDHLPATQRQLTSRTSHNVDQHFVRTNRLSFPWNFDCVDSLSVAFAFFVERPMRVGLAVHHKPHCMITCVRLTCHPRALREFVSSQSRVENQPPTIACCRLRLHERQASVGKRLAHAAAADPRNAWLCKAEGRPSTKHAARAPVQSWRHRARC